MTEQLRGKQQLVECGQFIDSIKPRLNDRCSSAEMILDVEIDDDTNDVSIETDPDAIEQILFNLVENAWRLVHQAKSAKKRRRPRSSRARDHKRRG